MKSSLRYIAVKRVNEICFFIVALFFVSPLIVNLLCQMNGSNANTTEDYISIQTWVGVLSIIMAAAQALYYFLYNRDRGFKTLLKEKREIAAFIIYIILALCSTIANSSDFAWFGESNRQEGFFVFLMYVFMFVMAGMLKSEKLRRVLIYILCGVSVYIGILTFLVNKEIVGYQTLLVIKDAGVFLQHNHYGYYLATTGIVMAAFALTSKKLWLKVLFYAGYAFTVYIMLLIGPLGPFLATIAGSVFIIIVYCLNKKRFSLQSFLPAVILGLALVLFTFLENNTMMMDIFGLAPDIGKIAANPQDAADAGTARWGLWVFTAEKIAEKPLLGYGACGIMAELKLAGGSYITHNEFLQYAVFFGIPAVIAYISAAMLVFLRALKNRLSLTATEIAFLCAAFVYLVSSFFGVTMYYTAPFYYLFLGLAVSKGKREYEETKKSAHLKITGITKGSPADKAGIKANDCLLSINGNKINDVLDYKFYTAEETLMLVLESGKRRIRKNEYDDLGLEFDTYLMNEKQHCKNNCIFCFVNQLPKGMRDTLYFKDDDARLSFLQGNYITLTNLSEQDVDRIIKMKLNVNISVHTTNPNLRNKMLRNPKAGEALKYLYKMAEAGIQMNCQIVLCPGINDGKELRSTLQDLVKLYPSVGSIACVPVGLTKYRDGQPKLTPFDKNTAVQSLEIIESFGANSLKKHNCRLVYPSDELFVIAERNIPDYDYYGDFAQYENGVGMWAYLENEFNNKLNEMKKNGIVKASGKKTIATGVMAEPLLKKLLNEFNEAIKIIAVKNKFFGESITVSGLITGQDLISQLTPVKEELGEEVLIPSSMLRAGESTFLDDITVEEAGAKLGIKIRSIAMDGNELLNAILN